MSFEGDALYFEGGDASGGDGGSGGELRDKGDTEARFHGRDDGLGAPENLGVIPASGVETCFFEHSIYVLHGAGASFAGDEALLPQVRDGDVFLLCKRVFKGNYQDQLVFEEGLLLHPSMGDPGPDESEVTLGGADHIGDVAGVSDFYGGLDGGMEGNEAGEEAGENELAGDGARSQGESATDLAGEVFELLI